MFKSSNNFKIISGGQTGVDRAALDFSISNNIPHGGWCPKGRIAEDGVLPKKYQLTETPSERYEQRTEWNVRDSDGTVIFSRQKKLTSGSDFTAAMARKLKKPLLHLRQQEISAATAARQLEDFIIQHQILTLNVAGTRQSLEPEVGGFVKQTLGSVFEK